MATFNASASTQGFDMNSFTSIDWSSYDGFTGSASTNYSFLTQDGQHVELNGSGFTGGGTPTGGTVTSGAIDLNNDNFASPDIVFSGFSGSLATMTNSGASGNTSGFYSEILSGNDTVTGSGFADTLKGLGGDDSIMGGAGSDSIDGGDGADVIDGETGDDIINGGDGNDFLSEGSGSGIDTLNGDAGDDYIVSGSVIFSDVFDGGTGVDTIDWSGSTESGIVFDLEAGTATSGANTEIMTNFENLKGTGQADTILGSSLANLLDGGDGYSLTSFEGSIFRLYQATLDRAPDEPGFDNWSGQLAGGTALLSIATGFVQSVEFQQTFGSLNDTQFVTLLYNNVLGRMPDPAGLANWTGALAGGASRESVVLGFSESQEFKNLTSISSSAFATAAANDEAIGEVFRIYQATLGRAPDEGGFINWINALAAHTLSLLNVASSFVQSAEFQLTYGSLNDTQFVTLLYNNVLGRVPDPAGLANWMGALADGASRESVVLGFSESQEFIGATAAPLMTFMRTGLPTLADTLTGGSGDDILFGGAGADSFNFIHGASGSDTVFGYEEYDTLSLSGFGYADAADALTHFTQVGNDVVFQDQGQTILFAETNLAAIQNSNLLLI